mgnify:CR=1 FL=1
MASRRENPQCDLSGIVITRDIYEVANNPDIDVLVELIGGVEDAKDLILLAVKNKKHVVTANKALIANAWSGDIFGSPTDGSVRTV